MIKLLAFATFGVSLAVGASALAAYPECPMTQQGDELNKWRQGAVDAIYAGDFRYGTPAANSPNFFPTSGSSVLRYIDACFPQGAPACFSRLESTIKNAADTQGDLPLDPVQEETKMRTPPAEFFAPGPAPTPAKKGDPAPERDYVLFQEKKDPVTGKVSVQSIEEIAKSKGWPTVRYRSRHAGGFDEHTASLLMIRIPGDKQDPPVDFDQYINIGIPPDAAEVNAKQASEIPPVPTTKIPTDRQAYENEDDNQHVDKNGDEITSVKYLPTVMTMLTVQKATDGRPAKVLYNMFNREDGTPNYQRDTTSNLRADNCYSCHPNGLREISPLGYHVRSEEQARGQMMPPDAWLAVQEMNNSMNVNQGFKPIDWGAWTDKKGVKHPAVDPEAFGPSYGPVRPLTRSAGEYGDSLTRTSEFIVGREERSDSSWGMSRPTPASSTLPQSGCATKNKEINVQDIFGRSPGKDNVYKLTANPPIRWQKVADAMTCSTCHNNRVRGALNSQTDFSQIQFKILVDQSMPMGAHRNPHDVSSGAGAEVEDDLNPNERIALVNCLKAEFDLEQQQLPKWITENSCDKNQNVSGMGSSYGGAGMMGTFIGNVSNPPAAVPPAAVSAQPRRMLFDRTPTATPSTAPAANPGQ